ncbi:nuclear transport factor 2 family protein [Micromonospora sp. 15K316]|uniref:nuclear transport factor 2 family protein n=1 Tax=Micromonospora sp. 15K316 TaxID=2530376 RepID=UPI00104E9013|nr:nuclear transport factor 2 family protein [Micromonospora sp. 15K316]TDC34374.1 nuclear transport factor 2 family protein [Micromonospora sp. 15K316]
MADQVRLSDALNELALAPTRALDDALDAYYAPDYTHRSDGKTLDRAEFTQLVAGMRDRVVSGTVTVLDEIRHGTTYAERHVYEITMTDGTTARREISVFGSFAEDGRFRHLSETGFDLAPDETTPTA